MKLKLTRLCALLLALLTLCLPLVSCKDSEDEVPENMQHATVEGSDYRLFLPVDWNLLTNTGLSGGYASAQNKAIIYVKTYDNPEGLSIKDYWNTHLSAALSAAFPDSNGAQCSDFIEGKLSGLDALTVNYKGTRALVSYEGLETMCQRNGKIYVLSFCARHDLYEGYLDVFETVREKFTFSDTPFVPKEPLQTINPDVKAPQGMKLASNDDVAYRFFVPESWVLDTKVPTSSAYVSESDRSNVGVTVYMPEVDHIESVDDYWATAFEQIKAGMTVVGDVEDEEITFGDRPGKIYRYTAQIEGTTFRFAQAITSYRGMVYTVTYTALLPQFEAHYPTYLDILAAFEFRGN